MKKILAIDDNKDNLISLKAILNDVLKDVFVLTALDGPKGIEIAIAEDPDVILLDIVMPGMDGFEVCRQLKMNERVCDIPVVFLTALKSDKESRIKALEYGAEGFLSKPIDEIELTAQIRAMIKIKASNEQKREEKERLKRLVAERTEALENELTERERTELLLKESEFFFKQSQIAAYIGSYHFNLVDNYWSSSEILEQILGIDTRFNKTLEGWLGLAHPDDRKMMETYFLEEVIGKKIPFNKEYRIIRQTDGDTRWVLGLGKLIFDESGNIVSMAGTIQDINQRKQQEESLNESFKLNQSLLQTIPFGMDIVDEEGNILFISDNLKNRFGENAIGQKCWNLYRDDKTQCTKCPLYKGINIGETHFYEASGILGGRTFQISHTGMIFEGKRAMLEIFQDISEKIEVEQKLKLLAHALESINECVSITDNNDHIVYINKSFINTYNYNTEELIGQPTSMLRSPEMALEHVRDILPVTIEGGWKGEIMNRKKDGTLFPIELSTSVIKDEQDKPVALIGVATDITERKKSRAELIAAKEQAEESNHLKSAFLNNMSHEIRTPMNHIMGFSSLMAEVHGEEKDAFAEIILKSSNQLLSLIENVILLSRLQSEKTKIVYQELNPVDLITTVANRFQSEVFSKKISLRVRIPQDYKQQPLLSDLEKIRMILVNLTSNAIKYTFSGFVEIGFEELEDKIKFYVKDTGMGIPEQELEKVFESFYRTEEAIAKAIGGTGLGLSIVKELVNSLNGTIGIESETGKGSYFHVILPAIRCKEVAEGKQSVLAKHQPLKDISILVADDEQINFLYLEILLKNNIKRIDHAYNGIEALEMASKNCYNLILMDLKMPEMNGYEATKKLKQRFPDIPVIAQTAYASTEDRELAVQAGCDDFIAKPIKKSTLMDIIQKYS